MNYDNITKVTTNSKSGSILEVVLHKVTFKELWNKYPKEKLEHETNGVIDNYCAIHLSEAFLQNEINFKHYKEAKCWGCTTGNNNVHPIRAQELANWFKKQPFIGCPKPEKYTGENYEENIDGRTGIIFFKDYWQRPKEIGTEKRTGDHIDLWDGKGLNKLAGYNLLENFVTNTLGIYIDSIYSNKEKSKQVLFWEIQ